MFDILYKLYYRYLADTSSKVLEIMARPESEQAIRDEFAHFIDKAKQEQWEQLKVLFGFAWGNFIYKEHSIKEIMSPDELAHVVSEAEARKDGTLGYHDLFVTPIATGIKHTFCHETDIHLEGPPDSEYIQAEKERYKSLGWDVHERFKDADEDSSRPVNWHRA